MEKFVNKRLRYNDKIENGIIERFRRRKKVYCIRWKKYLPDS